MAFNVSNNPSVTLIVVAAITVILLAYALYNMGVYKDWLHNALEIALLSNLAILSVVMFYALLISHRLHVHQSLSLPLFSSWLLLNFINTSKNNVDEEIPGPKDKSN